MVHRCALLPWIYFGSNFNEDIDMPRYGSTKQTTTYHVRSDVVFCCLVEHAKGVMNLD